MKHKNTYLFILCAFALLMPATGPTIVSAKANKIDICHIAQGSGKIIRISVAEQAWPAHEAHGDYEVITWYADADGDGFGDADVAVQACEQPEGYIESGGDCDDGDADRYPGAVEVCNGLDDDCDGLVDEGDVCEPPALDISGSCVAGKPQVVIVNTGGPMPAPGTLAVEYEDGTTATVPFQLEAGQELTTILSNIHGWIVDAILAGTSSSTGPIENCLEAEVEQYIHSWLDSSLFPPFTLELEGVPYDGTVQPVSYATVDYHLMPQVDNDYLQTDQYFDWEIPFVLQRACYCSPADPFCCLVPDSILGTINIDGLLFEEYIVIDVAEGVPPSFGGISGATSSLIGVDIDVELVLLPLIGEQLTSYIAGVKDGLAAAHEELTFEIWDQHIDPLLTE